MQAIRKILIAVKNPDARRQPGVDKALSIAKTLGASVELFHAISAPVFMEIQPLTGRTIAELRKEALELRRARLAKLVARAQDLGITAAATVDWDFPPHEAIVRRAIESRADLIIAECHKGRRLAPWLVHLTDWELLRASPMPVLLLKSAKPWRNRAVLAAVDPTHAHAKPSGLDARIVARASQLAAKTGGPLHVIHATLPLIPSTAIGDPGLDSAALAASYEQWTARRCEDFTAFAKGVGVPRTRLHVLDGSPVVAIPAVARQVGADLVVMGAVSRSGLKRIFIGNTAERVLNDLPCDVLVVKPANFTKRVPARSRGMRVVPPQPILRMTA
jgi:universal stress protein E